MALLRKILFCNIFIIALFASCDEFGAIGGEHPGVNVGDSSQDTTTVQPNITPIAKGDTVSRTLLLYLIAENSISDYLEDDFEEIKSAAYDMPGDVRLFVYFDNSDTTRLPRLVQYQPYNKSLIEDVVCTFEEDVCSSDTAVLGKVLDVVFDNYPTKSFDLVLGSHADGWVRHRAASAPNRIIGIDNERNTYSNTITTTIEIEELAALLGRLPVKVDRLMFDACLMQGVEVAYALRNVVNWVVASPAEIPAYGAPYDKVVLEFFNPLSDVEDIMYEYKKSYDNESYAAVLSAVNTSYMQELADSTSRYVKKYFDVDSVYDYTSSLAYVPQKAPAYYDINSVMKRILDSEDYEQWKTVFDKAVPYAMISNSRKVWSNMTYSAYSVVEITDDCGAVSAYFPQNKSLNSSCNDDFRTTEWYKAAGWDVAGW